MHYQMSWSWYTKSLISFCHSPVTHLYILIENKYWAKFVAKFFIFLFDLKEKNSMSWLKVNSKLKTYSMVQSRHGPWNKSRNLSAYFHNFIKTINVDCSAATAFWKSLFYGITLVCPKLFFCKHLSLVVNKWG